VEVTFYTKPGCCLCDDARDEIEAAIRQLDPATVRLVEINILSDLETFLRFRYDIPVIAINGVPLLKHRITAEALLQKLKGLKPK
jgi:glutaredoxin